MHDHLNSCHPERGTGEAAQTRPHRRGGTRSFLVRRPVIAVATVATSTALAVSGIAVLGISASAQATTRGVTTASAATVLDASAMDATVPAVVAGPGHWVGLTPKAAAYMGEVGLVRGADGVLHVLWGGGSRIVDTPIAPKGTPGKTVTVASGLLTGSYPDATATPGGLYVLWNGDKTGPRATAKSAFWATRPLKGGNWRLGGNVPPAVGAPVANGGSVAAATGGDGKPWIAYTTGNALVVLHLGQQQVKIAPSACCVIDPGLATDGKSGVTWLGYYSVIPRKQGYTLQKLSKNATSGNAIPLPGVSGGTVWPQQRVALTGRGKGRGGVYMLYGGGYDSYTQLNLITAGSTKPVSLGIYYTPNNVMGDAITAGPDGRLWAAWWIENHDDPAPTLVVRATKTATGTAFGKTITVPLPKDTHDILKVYTSAQAGRLDVVALLETGRSTDAYYATQVLLPK